MANRAKGFGLSKEVADRIDAKYSEDDEREVVAYMSSILGEGPAAPGREAFHAWLQDGLILCRFMNILSAGSCTKMNLNVASVKLAAMRKNKEMENIGIFLNAAEKYGMKKQDMFQGYHIYRGKIPLTLMPVTFSSESGHYWRGERKFLSQIKTVDLYENQNMAQVLTTIYKLSAVATKNGFNGPTIGAKIANENVRSYDEQKLREGRNIIGLQMGTNQVASQQGMTPYGLGRQLTPGSK